MDFNKSLMKIGLTANEATVYLVLLKYGEAGASKIAEASNLNRSLIYRVLEELAKISLVSSFIRENKTYFKANSPRNLNQSIKEKEEELDLILSGLLTIEKKSDETTSIEVYSGLEGIKAVLRDQLTGLKEFYVLGAGNEFATMTSHFYDQYYITRIDKKIVQKVLFKKEAYERAKKSAQSPYSEVRILQDAYKVPVATIIYRNKTALISWLERKAVVITSDKITQGFKEQFKIFWESAQKV